MTLPTDPQERKRFPIFSGVMKYFPDAITEVAYVSAMTSKQHNPDKPMQWDRSKSGDEMDALLRHALHVGEMDTDGTRHSAKVAWRALANLQKELEGEVRSALDLAYQQQAAGMANEKALSGSRGFMGLGSAFAGFPAGSNG